MPDDVKPLPSQGNQTANARRKYLHVLEGGTLRPHDLSLIVADMEAQDARVAALEGELAKAGAVETPQGWRWPFYLAGGKVMQMPAEKWVAARREAGERIAALEAENAKLREIHDPACLSAEQLAAILARLEAAERVCEAAQTVANMVSKGSIRPDTYLHGEETQSFAWGALEDLDNAVSAYRALDTKEPT